MQTADASQTDHSNALRRAAVKVFTSKLEKEIHSLERHLQADSNPFTSSDASASVLNIDGDHEHWKTTLREKLLCRTQNKIIYYHYHARKAAGTTIRDFLKLSSRFSRTTYLETEGVVLDSSLLEVPGIFSIVSLRDPISRILSLYWYEHVGWYAGVLKQAHRCRPLRDWVAAWRDGAPLKKQILARNPKSNYVEIENYYTKMLIGWDGSWPLGERDLERAKAVLRQFDIIVISEWLHDETQVEALNALFKSSPSVSLGSKVVGDRKVRTALSTTLSPDEENIRQLLKDINQYDIALYDYAQSLTSLRLRSVLSMVSEMPELKSVVAPLVRGNRRKALPSTIASSKSGDSISSAVCAERATMNTISRYRNMLGVFQPPGHKGP